MNLSDVTKSVEILGQNYKTNVKWNMSHPALELAIKYLADRGHRVPSNILVLSHRKEMKQAGDYGAIRDELWIAVYDAIYDYLTSTIYTVRPRAEMSTAVSKSYIETADTGYVDGGGELPLDDDTAIWTRGELDAQLGYVDSLFQTLKALRNEGDFDANSEAANHADGYARSLDMLYNGAKLAGAGNKMLEFIGDDGEESCEDCQMYKGQRHRASWWIAHDAVPPNRRFICGGYRCQHYLVDDNGEEFTI